VLIFKNKKIDVGFTLHLFRRIKNFNKKYQLRKGEGFTIAELLVVIAIISILSSVVLVATKGARERAKQTAILQFSASVYHALGADIIGYWSFDDSSDLGKDSVGDHNGTGYGTINPVEGIVRGGVKVSDGGGIIVPDSDDLDGAGIGHNVTIEFWMKAALLSSSDWNIVVTKYTNYHIGIYQGYPRAYFKNVGSLQDTSYIFEVNKWYHYLITYDGLKLKLFINGKERDSVPATNDLDNNNRDFYIGRYGTTSYYFDGIVDEVRIYKSALSSAQIRKLYAEGAEKHGLVVK